MDTAPAGEKTFEVAAVDKAGNAAGPASHSYAVTEAPPDEVGCDIKGTNKDDVLRGTAADEVICGLGGNDTIIGGGGKDELRGHSGNDRLDSRDGVRGNDTNVGGRGLDICQADRRDKRSSCP